MRNGENDVLPFRRSDSGLWALSGGAQDIGEYIVETAVRETLGETGIDVRVTGLIGIHSNPHHVIAYSDGEVRQQLSICFGDHPVYGGLRASKEPTDVRWITRSKLNTLTIHESTWLRIDDRYASRRGNVYRLECDSEPTASSISAIERYSKLTTTRGLFRSLARNL